MLRLVRRAFALRPQEGAGTMGGKHPVAHFGVPASAI